MFRYSLTGRPQNALETLTSLRQKGYGEDDCEISLWLASLSATLEDSDTSTWYYNEVSFAKQPLIIQF